MHRLVGALLLQDGCILLGHRSASRAFSPDIWDVAGGHCEEDETLEEALVRELRDEIGIAPSVWQELAIVRESDGANEMFDLHLYHVSAWESTPRNLLPEEHDRIAWFKVEEACHLALASPEYPELFRSAR